MSEKPPKTKSKEMQVSNQNKPFRKASHEEMDNRVKEVVELIINGSNRLDILRYSANNWGLAERATDEIVARARRKLVELNNESLDESIALITSNLWGISKEARQAGEYSAAVSAIKEVAKIKGLDQITINHVHHKPEDYDGFDDDDAIEAELVKK